MNPILQSLFERKSVRAFTDQAISPQDKRLILESATQAPSAGCQQLYTILDITDQALKDALAVSCDNQPFLARAPLVLIFCADCTKWFDAYRAAGAAPRQPGVGDLLLAVEDATIAAQNAVTAAQSLGLGSCYIGDVMERYEEHRRLLHLPRWVVPAVLLVVGYPTVQQQQRQKPARLDLSHLVCENTYQRKDEAALRQMFEGHTDGKPFDGWMAAFCKRKYNADFSREMTRSVGAYLRDFACEEPIEL